MGLLGQGRLKLEKSCQKLGFHYGALRELARLEQLLDSLLKRELEGNFAFVNLKFRLSFWFYPLGLFELCLFAQVLF